MARAKKAAPWLKDVLRRAEAGSPAFEAPVVKVIALEQLSLTPPERSLHARFGVYAVTAEAELRRGENNDGPSEKYAPLVSNGEAAAQRDEALASRSSGADGRAARLTERLGKALAMLADRDCDRAFAVESEGTEGRPEAGAGGQTRADRTDVFVSARASVAELPEALAKSALMRQASAVLREDAG